MLKKRKGIKRSSICQPKEKKKICWVLPSCYLLLFSIQGSRWRSQFLSYTPFPLAKKTMATPANNQLFCTMGQVFSPRWTRVKWLNGAVDTGYRLQLRSASMVTQHPDIQYMPLFFYLSQKFRRPGSAPHQLWKRDGVNEKNVSCVRS